jgi:hypothetical protein
LFTGLSCYPAALPNQVAANVPTLSFIIAISAFHPLLERQNSIIGQRLFYLRFITSIFAVSSQQLLFNSLVKVERGVAHQPPYFPTNLIGHLTKMDRKNITLRS